MSPWSIPFHLKENFRTAVLNDVQAISQSAKSPWLCRRSLRKGREEAGETRRCETLVPGCEDAGRSAPREDRYTMPNVVATKPEKVRSQTAVCSCGSLETGYATHRGESCSRCRLARGRSSFRLLTRRWPKPARCHALEASPSRWSTVSADQRLI